MLVANQISLQRGYIPKKMTEGLNGAIRRIIIPGFIKKEYFAGGRYLEILKKDKKFEGKFHSCILFEEDGVKKNSYLTDAEISRAIQGVFYKKMPNS